jgi:hypothetical protein
MRHGAPEPDPGPRVRRLEGPQVRCDTCWQDFGRKRLATHTLVLDPDPDAARFLALCGECVEAHPLAAEALGGDRPAS